MKLAVNNINKGKELENSIPDFANGLSELYYKRACIEFAMDYHTLYDMVHGREFSDDNLIEIVDEFNEVSGYVIEELSSDTRKELIEKISLLKDKVFNVVKVLAGYADIFARYEYVYNRIEHTFDNVELGAKYKDEDFTRNIMHYIFDDDKDNALVNSKISEIVSELPFRMTKNKFFELLKNGLSVYKTSDKQAIDDFIYNIMTSGMLLLPENMDMYPEFLSFYKDLKSMDFSNVTQNDLDNISKGLKGSAADIEDLTDIYMVIQGLVNKAYAIILTKPYIGGKDKEIGISERIIKTLHNLFYEGALKDIPEETTDLFVFLEGVPEDIHTKIEGIEYTLDTVRKEYMNKVQELGVSDQYSDLIKCRALLSDSLFVDIDKELEMEVIDKDFDSEKYIDEKYQELENSLRDFFNDNSKKVNRSVMSLVISCLPIFFNNISEVQDYIYNSLNKCTDKVEKKACIELINDIINS